MSVRRYQVDLVANKHFHDLHGRVHVHLIHPHHHYEGRLINQQGAAEPHTMLKRFLASDIVYCRARWSDGYCKRPVFTKNDAMRSSVVACGQSAEALLSRRVLDRG